MHAYTHNYQSNILLCWFCKGASELSECFVSEEIFIKGAQKHLLMKDTH